MLLGIAQVVCFCLFMKAAPTYVRRDDLAGTANIVMYGLTIGPFLAVLATIAAPLLTMSIDPIVDVVSVIVACVIGLAVLVFWVMQLFLMFRLGTAMKNY